MITGYDAASGERGVTRRVHVTLTEYPLSVRHGLPHREPVTVSPDPAVAEYWRACAEEAEEWERSVALRWHV